MTRGTEVVYFSGQVQGVGFRMTTRRLAQDIGIDGYVQNLADGRVEMVATAEPEAISRLIARLRGVYGDGIESVARSVKPNVEEFSGFQIRR